MVIDFEKIERKELPNFKGGDMHYDVKMWNDDQNRIMHGMLQPGASIGKHRHDDNCEIIYVLEGKGVAIIDGEEERLSAGMCHYCPKGSTHTLRCDGDKPLVFFAVVAQ